MKQWGGMMACWYNQTVFCVNERPSKALLKKQNKTNKKKKQKTPDDFVKALWLENIFSIAITTDQDGKLI